MDLATLFIVVAIIYGILFFFDSFFKVRISGNMNDCNLSIVASMLLNVSCFRAACTTLTSLYWKELD